MLKKYFIALFSECFNKPMLKPVHKVAGKIMTNGVKAPVEIANKRLRICNTCPYLIKTTRNCKKCLCFVDAKVKYRDQKCKLGKW